MIIAQSASWLEPLIYFKRRVVNTIQDLLSTCSALLEIEKLTIVVQWYI